MLHFYKNIGLPNLIYYVVVRNCVYLVIKMQKFHHMLNRIKAFTPRGTLYIKLVCLFCKCKTPAKKGILFGNYIITHAI